MGSVADCLKFQYLYPIERRSARMKPLRRSCVDASPQCGPVSGVFELRPAGPGLGPECHTSKSLDKVRNNFRGRH
jgi:hypothetical protein